MRRDEEGRGGARKKRKRGTKLGGGRGRTLAEPDPTLRQARDRRLQLAVPARRRVLARELAHGLRACVQPVSTSLDGREGERATARGRKKERASRRTARLMSEHPSVMTTSSPAPLLAVRPSSLTQSILSPSGARIRTLDPSLASSEKRRSGRAGRDGSVAKGRSWMTRSASAAEDEEGGVVVGREGRMVV